MLTIILIVAILFLLAIMNRIRILVKKIKNKRKSTLTKEEKLKYIDQLTSLKNRAYLNSKVEQWDSSDVYPQCVIVVDLNNIAYINDNYGREEGDKIILQAANILIMSQLPNTEIIRTDGNEFLIYLVGYPEKTVIAYLRKLQRLFIKFKHSSNIQRIWLQKARHEFLLFINQCNSKIYRKNKHRHSKTSRRFRS